MIIKDIIFVVNVAIYFFLMVGVFSVFFMYKYKNTKEIWKIWKIFIVIEISLNITKLIFNIIMKDSLEPIFGVIVLLLYTIMVDYILKKYNN